MKSAESMIPVPAKELARFGDLAFAFIKSAEWRPKSEPVRNSSAQAMFRQAASSEFSGQREVSLGNTSQAIGNEQLPNEEGIHILHVVYKGITIGMYLAELYEKQVGLAELGEKNRRGDLGKDETVQFQLKKQTAGAIAVFVTASYCLWSLSRYKQDAAGKVPTELPYMPEISLLHSTEGFNCLIYYLAVFLTVSKEDAAKGMMMTGPGAVKMATLYFAKVIEEIRLRMESFSFVEPFLNVSYKLEDEEFSVSGFEVKNGGTAVSVIFNKVDYGEIVGNRDAIHQSKRIIQRIVAGYNLTDHQNPFQKLGGISRVRMGKGIPGTGKSKLIAANATYLSDLAAHLKRPFVFSPLPDTIVSTFQGGSAERMVQWMQPFNDQDRIMYGPMDDAENVFEDRTRQGVSAGVREVIGVFLRYTEGAYAIDRGNVLLDIMTNLPEQLDPAILSRVQDRFDVNGARSEHDFLDQDYLWWHPLDKLVPKFVALKDPRDYKYLSDQRPLTSMSELYEKEKVLPQGDTLTYIFKEVGRKFSQDEHGFYAALFTGVQQYFPMFSSRDVRNIQRAVSGRVMDFDMPKEWFESPEVFADLPYDRRMAMVVELMKANTHGLSFAHIRLQETIRYLNVMTSITENAHRRKVEEYKQQLRIQTDAGREFEGEQKQLAKPAAA